MYIMDDGKIQSEEIVPQNYPEEEYAFQIANKGSPHLP